MIPYLKITSKCISCDNCRQICPEKAILKNKDKLVIETWSCTLCGACVALCPVDSISLVKSSDNSR